ncbi:hypothetical protein Tco_0360685 [Tanacetum coccineum]
MSKLAFCDYHNMVAILEKTEHNTDFHQIVYFLEASPLRIETSDGGTNIIAKVDGKQRTISESSIRRHLKLNDEEGISTLPNTDLFEILSLMGYNILPNQSPKSTGFNEFSSNIATAIVCLATNRVYNFSKMILDVMSKVLSPRADELVSLPRDDRHGEAFPTASSLDAGMQQNLNELMDLCTSLQRQHTLMEQKIISQDLEITQLKTRDLVKKSTDKGSKDTVEVAHALNTMEAANVLSSGGAVSTLAEIATIAFVTLVTTAGVATVSGSVPAASAIFTTASVVTPYSRRTRVSRGITIEPSHPSHTTSVPTVSTKGKGKEKVVESTGTKKKKIQEQLDAQVARELAEEFAQEEQVFKEQAEKDYEIARIQAEEELRLMIDELDRNNEMIAKHMNEYEQAEDDLSLEEKTELINELIKYQRNLAQIKKYQAQQSKLDSKTKRIKFYTSVLRSHAGWKTESERVKRPGFLLAKESSKRLKTSKASRSELPQEQQTKDPKELSEEEMKKMMEIVLVEEVYVEALQKFDREDMDTLWSLVKETFSSSVPTEDKEKELWVDLNRLYEPDPRDQLWARQRYMHNPLEWKLYDTCGVHHVFTGRGHKIFMLVEKDYPLTKGLTTLMIIQDEDEEMFGGILSRLAFYCRNLIQIWSIKFRGGLLGIKCTKAFPLLVIIIPTASEFSHCEPMRIGSLLGKDVGGKGVDLADFLDEVTAAQVKNRSRIGINKWYQSFALRNFDLEDMELESTNSGPTAKLPILKLGEYEMWAIRIKQYFQIQDYALWEVIENGDSWVSISQTTEENGKTVSKMSTPATAEEKIKKKNDVKARGLLLMALPNEHQLTFSQYPDAKSMFAAIETC